jgi:hypothetical protein
MRRTLSGSPGPAESSGDSWYAGALGEIAVAGVLSSLSSEWTVLHSVPVGKSNGDIDHVVIGPAGVFTINTKNHSGQNVTVTAEQVTVSDRSTWREYIPAAIREAADAEARLSAACGLTVPVAAVIVLVDPGRLTTKAAPRGGVRVVADSDLLALLQRQTIFSVSQVARIVEAAIKPGTWHDNPRVEVDGPLVALRFNAIMARAAQATRQSTRRGLVGSRRPKGLKDRAIELLAGLVGLGLIYWILVGLVLPALQGIVQHAISSP